MVNEKKDWYKLGRGVYEIIGQIFTAAEDDNNSFQDQWTTIKFKPIATASISKQKDSTTDRSHMKVLAHKSSTALRNSQMGIHFCFQPHSFPDSYLTGVVQYNLDK